MIGRRVQQEYLSNELKNLPGEVNTVACTLAFNSDFPQKVILLQRWDGPLKQLKNFGFPKDPEEGDWFGCDKDLTRKGVEVTSISLNRQDNEYILIREFVMARSLSHKAVSVFQAIAITAAIAIISGQIQLDFTSISEALSNSSLRIHIPLLDKG